MATNDLLKKNFYWRKRKFVQKKEKGAKITGIAADAINVTMPKLNLQ
jgi:hypothetical protein